MQKQIANLCISAIFGIEMIMQMTKSKHPEKNRMPPTDVSRSLPSTGIHSSNYWAHELVTIACEIAELSL